jgi:predicted DNA-binding transcriptional regulator YafY
MRADRLLSLLMLLQTRGRMTARELAAELEVSERTIYRDIDALAIAGVPVYTERGTGGGCALLENYRTTLTGLTADEVRALFLLSIPAPLAQLGLRDTLKSALLKLTASLPAHQTDGQMTVRQRLHIDSTWWFQADEPVPHLAALQQAVWQDRRVHVVYRLLFDTRIEREVEPYGLVAKAGVWFVVCYQGERLHVYRVSDLTAVHLCAETFARPADFDLAAFWADWCQHYEHDRPHYPVIVRVAPEHPALRFHRPAPHHGTLPFWAGRASTR